MGFFSKKVTCGTCSSEVGLNRYKTADGWICPSCFKACGYTFSTSIKKKNQEEINNDLAEMEKQLAKISQFNASQKVQGFLEINDEKKLWFIPNTDIFNKNKVPKLRKYSDIVDFELLEDGEVVSKGGLGRAVAGGVLFGAVGAIVGGVTSGKKTKEYCTSLKIKITLNTPAEPIVYIDFLDTKHKKNSFTYKTFHSSAQETMSLLTIIKNQNSATQKITQSSETSVADELMKFKTLLDQGVLTQEEFDIKKKELLNL